MSRLHHLAASLLCAVGMTAACAAPGSAPDPQNLTFVATKSATASASTKASPHRLPVPTQNTLQATLQADGKVTIDCRSTPNPAYQAARETLRRNEEH